MTTLAIILYSKFLHRWKRIAWLEHAEWSPWADRFLCDEHQREILRETAGMTRQEAYAWVLARSEERRA